MAVREFDGVDDNIICATGAASTFTHGTVAALLKKISSADYDTWFATIAQQAGGTLRLQVAFAFGSETTWWNNDTSNEARGGFGNAPDGDWLVVVTRKATGTSTVRASIYNFSTASWTHFDLGTLADVSSPGNNGSIQFESTFTEFFQGRVAVRGAWSNSLPWSADVLGDVGIENAGLETALQNWVDASPSALWRFDQTTTADPVPDITGGGADQTGITGTTVVTTDDPPGFDFNLAGGDVTGTLAGTLPELTGTIAADATVTVALAGALPQLTGSLTGDATVSGSASAALPSLGGGLAATATASGALAGSLPELAGSFAGTAETEGGRLRGVLPALTGTLDGTLAASGLFTGTLPALAGDLAAEATATGAVAGDLPALAGAFTVNVDAPPAGEIHGTLPQLTGALTGAVSFDASLAVTLPPLIGDLTGFAGIIPPVPDQLTMTAIRDPHTLIAVDDALMLTAVIDRLTLDAMEDN